MLKATGRQSPSSMIRAYQMFRRHRKAPRSKDQAVNWYICTMSEKLAAPLVTLIRSL